VAVLKSEHLAYTVRSGRAYPRFVRPDRGLPWAEAVLGVIAEHHRLRRGELMEALHALEGDSPDYNLVRGLAHLALSEAAFALGTSLELAQLREEAFALAAQRGYSTPTTQGVLRELAERHALEASQIPALLYADLPDNHLLVRLPDLTPAQLLDRYNLAQAQGLLYSATHLVLQVHRNEVGEYKKLFRYLKFYRLMFTVEGDLDSGYRIHVDGPASLFQATRRYGVRMAALLPALLHVTRWELTARLWLQGQAVELCPRLARREPAIALALSPPPGVRLDARGHLRPALGEASDSLAARAGGGGGGPQGHGFSARLRPAPPGRAAGISRDRGLLASGVFAAQAGEGTGGANGPPHPGGLPAPGPEPGGAGRPAGAGAVVQGADPA